MPPALAPTSCDWTTMNWITLAALGVLFLAGCAFVFGKRVDPAKARELVANGALLLDVRSPEEFASGHIKGAKNIPVGSVAGRVSELGDRSRAIVVYCRSGMRSSRAAGVLRDAGFAHVHDLGGMGNWRD